MKIFVVEDERQLCDDIAEDLELERYTVERCYDGLEAWERILVESYDLVILDLNLPGMDGLDILRAVRREKPEQRVLILSARSTLADRVAGLDLGADDYLTKPFALEELEARVRALLRRDFASRDTALVVGPLTLDTQRREISAEGLPLSLTRKEFGILEYLMLRAGQAVSQEELLEHIWEADSNPFSHAVRMHISSLRKKLRTALGYDPIVTKIGQGYRLEVRT
ncbi:response regulator transcription factor [Pseudoflavonifractor sp. MCC625]|uniref:response regulator transcription factor n=1 Tax=Pseudoflavonifractor sp. MCC625 TaxID=2592647 RepID=UPI001C016740|nr:response regulator transcription factor [Pseudoflavonifractor sp. MCC625]MBT9684263.1 response regulator [Pseudoflavonifractor sp. MCC625]